MFNTCRFFADKTEPCRQQVASWTKNKCHDPTGKEMYSNGGHTCLSKAENPIQEFVMPSLFNTTNNYFEWKRTWLSGWITDCPPTDTLPGLLEALLGWALKYPKLLVLKDFNAHVDDEASSPARD